MNLRKLLPPGIELRRRVPVGTDRVPHYDFPLLDICRAHFAQRMNLGGRIDWTSGETI